jgi:hypothetical protein
MADDGLEIMNANDMSKTKGTLNEYDEAPTEVLRQDKKKIS